MEKLKLILAMTLLIFVSTPFALSALGEPCTFTGECAEGYCEGGICREPAELVGSIAIGACTSTADCFEGYCKLGQCIKPMREEYKIIPSLELRRNACAGIIENCVGPLCAVCNVNWPLLFVGAFAAGWVGRRRGRILPILLIALPMVIGLFVLPILGFLLSLVELFALAIVRR